MINSPSILNRIKYFSHDFPVPFTDTRQASGSLGGDISTGGPELEKGRVTPETLAADEEQDGMCDTASANHEMSFVDKCVMKNFKCIPERR